jgi:hypothetical protein
MIMMRTLSHFQVKIPAIGAYLRHRREFSRLMGVNMGRSHILAAHSCFLASLCSLESLAKVVIGKSALETRKQFSAWL